MNRVRALTFSFTNTRARGQQCAGPQEVLPASPVHTGDISSGTSQFRPPSTSSHRPTIIPSLFLPGGGAASCCLWLSLDFSAASLLEVQYIYILYIHYSFIKETNKNNDKTMKHDNFQICKGLWKFNEISAGFFLILTDLLYHRFHICAPERSTAAPGFISDDMKS